MEEGKEKYKESKVSWGLRNDCRKLLGHRVKIQIESEQEWDESKARIYKKALWSVLDLGLRGCAALWSLLREHTAASQPLSPPHTMKSHRQIQLLLTQCKYETLISSVSQEVCVYVCVCVCVCVCFISLWNCWRLVAWVTYIFCVMPFCHLEQKIIKIALNILYASSHRSDHTVDVDKELKPGAS